MFWCDYCPRQMKKEDVELYYEEGVLVLALCKDKVACEKARKENE
jgi:hypothetical protein